MGLICSLCVLLTFAAWRSARTSAEREQADHLDAIAEMVRIRAEDIAAGCRDDLRDTEALLAASQEVTSEEWDSFARGKGIGTAENPLQRLFLIEAHVHDGREICGSVKYAYPLEPSAHGPGVDLGGSPSLADAMRRSRATDTTVSARAAPGEIGPGDCIVMFDAVRTPQADASWIVGVIDPSIISRTLASSTQGAVTSTIAIQGRELASADGVPIAHSDWTLCTAFSPGARSPEAGRTPRLVLVIGLLATLLIGWVFGALSWTRSRAEILARHMTEAVRTRQAELLRSEERFRAIVEQQTDLIVRIRPDRSLSFVNDPFCAFFGEPRERLLGRDFLTFFEDPHAAEDWSARIGHLATSPAPCSMDARMVSSRLGERCIQWCWRVTGGNEAGDGEIQAIGRDITEQTAAERAVQGTLERLAMAQRLGRIGSFEMDVQSGTLECSEEIFRLLETDPAAGEMTLPRIQACFDPADVRAAREFIAHAIAEGKDAVIEPRMRLVSGRTVYYHGIIHPMRDASGRIVKVFGTVQDITARREAEETLRSQAMLLDLSFDAIMVRDLLNGTITYWNRGAERMYGWRAKEAIGSRVHELLRSRFPLPPVEIGARLIQDGRWEGEVIQTGKTGEPFVVASRWALLRDTNGVPTACMEVNTDITERKRAEEKERVYRAQLEEAHAYTEGQARELAKARDEALVLAKAKSEFLANMSHEIRTPMNGMIGMAGLLMETELTGEQREFAGTLCASAEALLGIVNDVLDFSKIEAGHLELESIPFDPAGPILEVASLHAQTAHQKGIDLVCDLDPALPAGMVGDPGRLRQVVSNLVGNAVKFTNTGYVVVRAAPAGAGSATSAAPEIRIEVEDTGIGIPRERQEAVFDSFTQADGSTTRQYGGTGLGLTISRRLVALMGGRLGLRSEVGSGSTFWVQIPSRADESGVERPAVPSLPTVRRALIADACPAARSALRRRLASWGIDTEEADSSERAVERIDACRAHGEAFDAVIIDDGILSKAASLAGHPTLLDTSILTSAGEGGETRVIVMCRLLNAHALTAVAEERLRRAALLFKPIRPASLLEALGAPRATVASSDAASGESDRLGASVTLNILVAEDNETNQQVLRRILERLGCRVTIARDGALAVSMAAVASYDLILLDLHMPILDGFQACRGIREQEQRLGLPPARIVAMTADTMPGTRARCLEVGMDDYLTKPIRHEDLSRYLTSFCKEKDDPRASVPVDPRVDEGTEPDVPVFDEGRLTDACGEDDEFKRGIVADFLERIGPRIDHLVADVEAADAASLESDAHACKGSALVLGADALGHVLQEIERLGKEGEIEAARRQVARAQVELERLRAVLASYLGRDAA